MSQTKQNDFTMRIGELVPKNQKLASVKPDDDLSQAMNIMKCNNYSQLPVRGEAGKLEGVISWRNIGEKGIELRSTRSMLVKDYMDTCVKAISLHTSLFDVIQEIEDRDYIVVKDSNDKTMGIITASDLANRFERFSKAFAYIGEIDLRLRTFIEEKLKTAIEIEHATKKPFPEFQEKDENDYGIFKRPEFGKYIKVLKYRSDILGKLMPVDDFIREINRARIVRNKVMHFKNHKLEGATEPDIILLKAVLRKVKMLSKD